jgi:hypothetical protein
MEVGGQFHDMVALPLGKKPQVSSGYEDVWASEPVWTLSGIQKFLSHAWNPSLSRLLSLQSNLMLLSASEVEAAS